jgi:hypothetical protein
MKLEGIRSPQWGIKKCQLLPIPCVTSSLALIALGGCDPSGGFHLTTLHVGRPLGNRGAHFGYGCHIPQCRGRVIIGVGVVHKTSVYCAFLQRPAALPPRLLHHGALKLAVSPARNLHPLT